MKISQHRKGVSAVVSPQGAILAGDADQLGAVLLQSAGEGAGNVTLNLAGVPFVDSRGLEMLMETGESLIRAGKVLRLAGTNDILRDVLRLTGLSPLFEYCAPAPAADKTEVDA
jgi:anti-sigma B factor antagonist